MIALDIEQRTEAWYAARLGIPTASEFDKIITTKGEPSKQAQKYLYRLAGERLTGFKEESYQSSIMASSAEREAEAREFYILTRDVEIKQVGICYPDESKRYACSPDGLIGEEGIIEIKCPLISTHVGYLLGGMLPIEYFQQVQGQLLVTGRKWCDFLSYFPGLKPLVVRVERDENFIAKLEAHIVVFCYELEKVVKQIA